MIKEHISTRNAPAAIGPYSQAVLHGDMLFASGQIPIDPATGTIIDGGIEEQTRQVLANIKGILTAAKMTMNDVIKTTIFLKNMNDFQIINKIYGEHFKEPYPARSTVEVARLPRDVMVEIEFVAVKN